MIGRLILAFAAVAACSSAAFAQPNFTTSQGVVEPAVPSAISNAVFDATGVRPRSVPYTPDKVKAAMRSGA